MSHSYGTSIDVKRTESMLKIVYLRRAQT